jgi:hypothetical protein
MRILPLMLSGPSPAAPLPASPPFPPRPIAFPPPAPVIPHGSLNPTPTPSNSREAQHFTHSLSPNPAAQTRFDRRYPILFSRHTLAGQVLVRDAICAVVTFGFYFGAFVLAALESPSIAVLALSNRRFPAMIVQASVNEGGRACRRCEGTNFETVSTYRP